MSIDYGLGTTNIDKETGIRFGVISQNAVLQAWADSSEGDYGDPTCGKCGNALVEYDDDKHKEFPDGNADCFSKRESCRDYACETCRLFWENDDCFPEEPIGWHYNGDGYVLTDCLDSDIFVLKSPYYTFADFCSPCVPGGGNLESFNENGAKSYCLGHDWFEGGIAPYPVYRVDDSTLVESKRHIEDAISKCHIARFSVAIEREIEPGDAMRAFSDNADEPINRVIHHLEEQL